MSGVNISINFHRGFFRVGNTPSLIPFPIIFSTAIPKPRDFKMPISNFCSKESLHLYMWNLIRFCLFSVHNKENIANFLVRMIIQSYLSSPLYKFSKRILNISMWTLLSLITFVSIIPISQTFFHPIPESHSRKGIPLPDGSFISLYWIL